MTRWLLLAVAILSEVAGTLGLRKTADGRGWYAVVAVGYVLSFVALAAALDAGLALGVAYGIWTACGVALTAVASRILFGEPLTALMSVGIAIIIGGVLLVELGAR